MLATPLATQFVAASSSGRNQLNLDVPLWAWFAVVGFIIGMLLVDLLVVNKDAHVVEAKEAAIWSCIWVAIGCAFGGLLWYEWGGQAAGQYFAGYVVEKSLSVDNLFVFAVVFSFFAVPAKYQHRVLFWGVLGALVFRAIFIAAGAALIQNFAWIEIVFGVFLIYTAIKMARSGNEEVHPENNPVLKIMRRRIPMTPDYRGQHFFVKENIAGVAKRLATPLFAVLVVVETTDILFAVDSIPAIFAISSEPFIVFTSNAFAILGLRALYFLLAGALDKFHYLKFGLAVILGFVGVKLLIAYAHHEGWIGFSIPIWLSLIVIFAVLGIAIVASLLRPLPEDAAPKEDHTGEGLHLFEDHSGAGTHPEADPE